MRQDTTHPENRLPPDPDTERALWNDFRLQHDRLDSGARQRLVEHYLPLVIKISRSMPQRVLNKIAAEELVGIGVIGLNKAIDSFSDNRNTSFSTYAFRRVKGAILDELRKMDVLTRTQRNRYREICAAINQLTHENSRPPTDEELSSKLGISISEIERYIGMASESLNLDAEYQEGINYIDVIPDDNASAPDQVTHQLMAIELLHQHFHNLTEREQKILYLRHFEEMSVKEVAQVLEISEGRISQIYQKVLLKLRALMENG